MRATPIRATPVTSAMVAAGLTLAIALADPAPAHAATRDWEKAAMYVPQAQALGKTKGEGVTIAVIGTGVDDTHPALKGKVTQGPDYAKGGLEKGSPGWGVHGTAMAYDALKVAPKARILSITANLERADPERHKDGDEYRKGNPTAKAISYAVGKGADVIAMSLGDTYEDFGGGAILLAEQRAVAYAISKGVPVIAPTGDDGAESDNEATYPAAHAGTIAVAATRPGGTRAPFSTVHTHNDVAAPGVDVHSAVPGGYAMAKGTSQAAALVSGVVALMKAKNPELTPAEIRRILRSTASHPSGGRDALVGYGQVNAYKAVRAAASPPKTLKAAPPYDGKANLGTPDKAERVIYDPVPTGLVVTYGVAGVLGVLLIGGGIVLLLRRRRSPAPAVTTPGAAPGPMPPGPGGLPPPGPGGQGRPPYGGQPYGGPPAGPPHP